MVAGVLLMGCGRGRTGSNLQRFAEEGANFNVQSKTLEAIGRSVLLWLGCTFRDEAKFVDRVSMDGGRYEGDCVEAPYYSAIVGLDIQLFYY